MPYDIEKRGERYCVIKREDRENMGCHGSRSAAERQRRAILANESRIVEMLAAGLSKKENDG